ncbi:GIY-YIG nuclease family protein (plasmid) [Rossellomorea sp. AcN35-11]|nr:GIY-YIG nuclease family protein [Rossellomorea aquimaris]WJV31943.1 GIY-YIG nuclease family protein [Rossellomorea sp. AcN35-11]
MDSQEKLREKKDRKAFERFFFLIPGPLLKEVSSVYILKKKLKKNPFKKNSDNRNRLYDGIKNKGEDPFRVLLNALIDRNSPSDRKTLRTILNAKEYSKYHSFISGVLAKGSLNKRIKPHTKSIKKGINGGFIYFIRENKNSDDLQSHIKIGSTNNLDRRLSELVVGVPYPLEFVRAIYSEDRLKTERLLHSHFYKQHINGEWFELSQKDVLAVKLLQLPNEILQSICVHTVTKNG